MINSIKNEELKINNINMKISELPNLNLKKIGGWATVVAVAMITYYSISTYKTYLEIKELKKPN